MNILKAKNKNKGGRPPKPELTHQVNRFKVEKHIYLWLFNQMWDERSKKKRSMSDIIRNVLQEAYDNQKH
jgi:hypothetical protein